MEESRVSRPGFTQPEQYSRRGILQQIGASVWWTPRPQCPTTLTLSRSSFKRLQTADRWHLTVHHYCGI